VPRGVEAHAGGTCETARGDPAPVQGRTPDAPVSLKKVLTPILPARVRSVEESSGRARTDAVTLRCFGAAAWHYWAAVFPAVCAELRSWRKRAASIPDAELSALALQALGKRGNMEGAAAFAAFAPRSRRRAVVRATVAFQAAYNYLDLLAEQRSAAPGAQARSLHRALVIAVSRDAPHEDYYEHSPWREDGGYLRALVDTCRGAMCSLPSVELVASAVSLAAGRVVEFQGALAEGEAGLARFGERARPAGSDLRWWELAAAAGSSLGLYCLIAAAADPGLSAGEVAAIEEAYFPWIGALHSLLDSVIDVAEDETAAQHSLVASYDGRGEGETRMGVLAEGSMLRAVALPHGERHVAVIAGMSAMYLSAPEAQAVEVAPVRDAVLREVGPLARLALLVFGARRVAETLYRSVAGGSAPELSSSRLSSCGRALGLGGLRRTMAATRLDRRGRRTRAGSGERDASRRRSEGGPDA
jgi:tetraprenyl-beta-curcumene synthase